jgi:hypothetical protein
MFKLFAFSLLVACLFATCSSMGFSLPLDSVLRYNGYSESFISNYKRQVYTPSVVSRSARSATIPVDLVCGEEKHSKQWMMEKFSLKRDQTSPSNYSCQGSFCLVNESTAALSCFLISPFDVFNTFDEFFTTATVVISINVTIFQYEYGRNDQPDHSCIVEETDEGIVEEYGERILTSKRYANWKIWRAQTGPYQGQITRLEIYFLDPCDGTETVILFGMNPETHRVNQFQIYLCDRTCKGRCTYKNKDRKCNSQEDLEDVMVQNGFEEEGYPEEYEEVKRFIPLAMSLAGHR